VVHLIRMPPGRLPLEVFRASDWEEAPGQNQNTLERLHISSGLGTPRDLPGGTGECCWGEGNLGGPPQATATATRPRTSGGEWMDGYH